jgi:hypothetical protein
MKWMTRLPLVLALLMLGAHGAGASTVYGDLNNFDVVNDTGQECHGFEIELDDVLSTDITYTYDWNHYGAPRIRQDDSDPAHPKVFIRYESAKASNGTWAAYTAVPAAPLSPTDGHSCTNPSVNQGCEHFGVGNYGSPTAARYHWLVDDGAGNLVRGPAVLVATPSWTYAAPALGQPAQVVAVIPAPVVPQPVVKRFGEPSWVKVIKTTTHNANRIALVDLASDDDANGFPKWQNNEPAEVETEWRLLQTNDGANVAKAEVQGLPDDMGDGNDIVTRRYEFYKYAGGIDTIDGERGEAMCDEVAPDNLHGIGNQVGVTDANGVTQYVDCSAQVVVGEYVGAQMAGFDAVVPLGLVDHLQDGEASIAYTPRTVVIGGNSPFAISISGGSLPQGLQIDSQDGVLFGTPANGGNFSFTVEATDADNITVSKAYTMKVVGGVVAQRQLSVGKSGSGTGSVTGSGIDCGATCTVSLVEGTAVSLTATPAAGSAFAGWSGACIGTGACTTTMSVARLVTATFAPAPQQYTLSVTRSGSGTVISSPKGISCGTQCTKTFPTGTNVTLTAKPARNHQFLGWSGGGCSGTSLKCTVPMLLDRNVQAVFN